MENAAAKKILVIGSGCAGLGAVWHLNKCGVDVQLYEADSRAGGHAHTMNVDGVDVDTGFMVYNAANYPNLCGFFEEMGIEGLETTMGFSVSVNKGSFEWCSDSISGLLATPSNILNPKFYLMMNDVVRFNKEATKHLFSRPDNDSESETVGEFLKKRKFTDAFRDYYLIPMTAAIWSASGDDILQFPAVSLFTFMHNHLLLQVSGHLNWRTPSKRSKEYVEKVLVELGKERVHLNRPVKKIERKMHKNSGEVRIFATDHNNITTEFDAVIFACHPDQALQILGTEATPRENHYLSSIEYADNDTFIHSDEKLMPVSRAAWTSWNCIADEDPSTGKVHEKPVFVTYWLNKLQHLNHDKNIFVTLNPTEPPAAEKTFRRLTYAHPQFTPKSVEAQRQISAMQGDGSTYFCGAWMGYGFHEDGFASGLRVATQITGVLPPWVGRQAVKDTANKNTSAVVTVDKGTNFAVTLLKKILSLISTPLLTGFGRICQQQVLAFIKSGVTKGEPLQIISPTGESHFINIQDGKTAEEPVNNNQIIMNVKKPEFFLRVALEADLGFCRSFIAGEWDIVGKSDRIDGVTDYDELTRLLELLIKNLPPPNAPDEIKSLSVSGLVTAWLGSSLNWLWYSIFLDNSIANSRKNIHAHYDLSNKLFQTFLDEEYMMYSCAIFDTNLTSTLSLQFMDTLEDAQIRKIDALLSRLEPLTPQHVLLDVGCGWGGISIRAAQKYGCKVVGITLSTEQKAFAEEKIEKLGLNHLITLELEDYRVFAATAKNKGRFDRIVSCEMIEAVGHNHLGTFFKSMDLLLKPQEGLMVMQAITMPDSRYPTYYKSADFCNTVIFPGGCCPSMSALLNAMANNATFHLETCTNNSLHYAETLRRWRINFNSDLDKVRKLGFDDSFIRLWNLYFCYCEAGFQQQVLNLQILSFSRPGNLNSTRYQVTDRVAQL